MDDATLKKILDGQHRLARTGLRRTIGICSSSDPFTVYIDGVAHVNVPKLDTYDPIGFDLVLLHRSGNDLLAIGRITPGDEEDLIEPTFATGWANYDASGYADVAFYREGGRVHLRGACKNTGSGTGTIFTLPPLYRPTAGKVHIGNLYGVGGIGNVVVNTDGTVVDTAFDAFSKSFTCLDGISFRIR